MYSTISIEPLLYKKHTVLLMSWNCLLLQWYELQTSKFMLLSLRYINNFTQ